MKLDIVIPIYNEEENLQVLHDRLKHVCDGLEDVSWRVIYVNDGSLDRSLHMMLAQGRGDSRFTTIELSRNFATRPPLQRVWPVRTVIVW